MNKSLKIALIVVGIIILLRLLMIAVYIFPELVPSKLSLDEHRAAVTKVINKEYPGYTITSLDLLYSDWSSTVREADKYNSPTKLP